MNQALQQSITQCWNCRQVCQETLYNHCLIIGGPHMEEQHVKLMTDCIQICQATADFMTRGSSMHEAICAICAEVCEACARACERIGDEAMMRCADACHACAKSCRAQHARREAA